MLRVVAYQRGGQVRLFCVDCDQVDGWGRPTGLRIAHVATLDGATWRAPDGGELAADLAQACDAASVGGPPERLGCTVETTLAILLAARAGTLRRWATREGHEACSEVTGEPPRGAWQAWSVGYYGRTLAVWEGRWLAVSREPLRGAALAAVEAAPHVGRVD